MAFDPKPESLFNGWVLSDGTISIPVASISGLTEAEANATTGSWPAVILRILQHTTAYYEGLAAADRPAQLEVRRNIVDVGGPLRQTFTANINTSILEDEVAT